MRGVIYIAFGERAKKELNRSVASLQGHCGLPITVIDNVPGADPYGIPNEGPGSGRKIFLPGIVKTRLWELSPYEETLYLDVDTRVRTDPTQLFQILGRGWDFAIAPGQAVRFLRDTQFGGTERDITCQELGAQILYYYNSGVFAWIKNERTWQLFQTWRIEWERFRNWDEQLALQRALWQCTDVKFVTLPTVWNSRIEDRALIHHYTGNRRAW